MKKGTRGQGKARRGASSKTLGWPRGAKNCVRDDEGGAEAGPKQNGLRKVKLAIENSQVRLKTKYDQYSWRC